MYQKEEKMSISLISSISLSSAMPASFKGPIKKIAPVSRRNTLIGEGNNENNPKNSSSGNKQEIVDKAEISETAKKLYADSYEPLAAADKQSAAVQNGFASAFEKAYFNNFSDEKIKDIPSHIRKSATKTKWNAEKYVKDVRGGFIVSGVNSEPSAEETTDASGTIRSRYEMENVRFPGHLLSVLA